MLKKITLTLIAVLSGLTVLFLIQNNIKYAITFGFIDLTVIVFSILVWFNDKYYNEQMSERIVSFPNKEMIKDILQKQSNMLRFDKIEEFPDGFKVYKGKQLVIHAIFEKDENGNILNIGGRYVVKLQAPEYVLHNIDNEIWSHIGK
ncbi:hypothetical protein [Sulfurihydrogenibium sp.]|uniref:hypothetical protein n=1 Tax=Sulfurihydrogenibium sp. TaxID=2053621 RepID=UPI0026100CEE|nr:hypothetical protein [Sulfurihydrogenibium sp.]